MFIKETSHKAIAGSCNHILFDVLFSPLLSRPKPDNSRRVIVHLTSPSGNSVNHCIDNDVYYDVEQYSLEYPSIGNIVDTIEVLSCDVMLS